MRRLAIFVEGRTEQVFVERLIIEIAEDKNIEIKLVRGVGPSNKRTYRYITATSLNSADEFFVIIYNSGGDRSVNADIKDQYKSLAKAGYNGIIGLKDVYPESRSDIPILLYYFGYKVPTTPIKPIYILSIMEIEAWFISEHHHFPKVDPALTCAFIEERTSYDPSTDDPQLLEHPAAAWTYFTSWLANVTSRMTLPISITRTICSRPRANYLIMKIYISIL